MRKTTYTTDSGYRVQHATAGAVFDFCQHVRAIGGGDALEALLPSVPNDSSVCLIARNLNFACEVYPVGSEGDGGYGASVYLDTKAIVPEFWIDPPEDTPSEDRTNFRWGMYVGRRVGLAKRLADAFGLRVIREGHNGRYVYGVELPLEIGNAADAFDNGAFKRYRTTKRALR